MYNNAHVNNINDAHVYTYTGSVRRDLSHRTTSRWLRHSCTHPDLMPWVGPFDHVSLVSNRLFQHTSLPRPKWNPYVNVDRMNSVWARVVKVKTEVASGNGRSVDTDDTHDGDDTGAAVFLCRRMVVTNK